MRRNDAVISYGGENGAEEGVKKMPNSVRSILRKLYCDKNVISEKEYNKLLRNIKTDWIPVTERLPDKNGDYLVTKVDDEDVTHNEFAFIDLAYYTMEGSWASSFTITAWMPLPKPYEEGAEE